jgi:hypothetical protein
MAKIARKYRVPWADLLQKVFAIDVLACPDCNGRMQLIAFIAQATVAKRTSAANHGLEFLPAGSAYGRDVTASAQSGASPFSRWVSFQSATPEAS